MRPIERIIRALGVVMILGALAINPSTVAFFLSADGKIESKGVIAVIVLFELALLCIGIIARRAPAWLLDIIRRRWKDVSVALLMYAVCEFIVLAFGIFLPRPTPERIRFFRDFIVPHEKLGYTTRPNLSNFELTWLDEGVKGVYDSDEYGFRNVGVSYASSSVFFIGDSFTHGSWVARDEAYYGQLAKKWNMPVITFGIGGYGLTQYAILARDFIPKTEANKTVIIGFFANDLEAPLPESDMASLYEKEMLSQIAAPSLQERFTFKYSVAGQLVKHLFRPREQAVMENGMSLFTNRGASIAFIRRDQEAFRAALEELSVELHARADIERILFVLIPSKESVYKEEYAHFFRDESYLENEAFGFNLIEAVGKEANIPVLDLTSIFRDHKEEKLYFDVDAHWNAAGHALAAEAIFEWIGK